MIAAKQKFATTHWSRRRRRLLTGASISCTDGFGLFAPFRGLAFATELPLVATARLFLKKGRVSVVELVASAIALDGEQRWLGGRFTTVATRMTSWPR